MCSSARVAPVATKAFSALACDAERLRQVPGGGTRRLPNKNHVARLRQLGVAQQAEVFGPAGHPPQITLQLGRGEALGAGVVVGLAGIEPVDVFLGHSRSLG